MPCEGPVPPSEASKGTSPVLVDSGAEAYHEFCCQLAGNSSWVFNHVLQKGINGFPFEISCLSFHSTVSMHSQRKVLHFVGAKAFQYFQHRAAD